MSRLRIGRQPPGQRCLGYGEPVTGGQSFYHGANEPVGNGAGIRVPPDSGGLPAPLWTGMHQRLLEAPSRDHAGQPVTFGPGVSDSVPDPLVFLVEGDDAVRDAVASALRADGLTVITYGSARQFLAAYGGQPGCLVADLDLPGMSGVELFARIRTAAAPLFVVFTSARLCPRERGAIGGHRPVLLTKPYGADELLVRIRRALADTARWKGRAQSRLGSALRSRGRVGRITR
jgi:CheY-like chemotaxis protein